MRRLILFSLTLTLLGAGCIDAITEPFKVPNQPRARAGVNSPVPPVLTTGNSSSASTIEPVKEAVPPPLLVILTTPPTKRTGSGVNSPVPPTTLPATSSTIPTAVVVSPTPTTTPTAAPPILTIPGEVSVAAFEMSPSSFNFDTREIDDICNDVEVPPDTAECDGFMAQPIGTKSAEQEFILYSTGGDDLIISEVSIDSNQFEFTSDCVQALSPRENCAVRIRFAPTIGGTAIGHVTMESSIGEKIIVTVQGTGGSSPGVVQFSANGYTVLESDHQIIVTIVRGQGSDLPVIVSYTVTAGTATMNVDYMKDSGTITFDPGDLSRAFVIDLVDDQEVEADETINLAITSADNGARLGSRLTATATIVDND